MAAPAETVWLNTDEAKTLLAQRPDLEALYPRLYSISRRPSGTPKTAADIEYEGHAREILERHRLQVPDIP
ncbi:MAG: hypothetical protein R3313_01605 [Candidatus Saccharimonadales bacterium]|nr:hypothetical protein [Candidatus Saccharimonadales bacterium]